MGHALSNPSPGRVRGHHPSNGNEVNFWCRHSHNAEVERRKARAERSDMPLLFGGSLHFMRLVSGRKLVCVNAPDFVYDITNWKRPKRPSAGELRNKLWHVHTVRYQKEINSYTCYMDKCQKETEQKKQGRGAYIVYESREVPNGNYGDI